MNLFSLPRHLRIGARLLARQPLQSAIELLGLATGFAVCFLLLGYAHYAFTYDRDVPARDQVYLVKHRLNFIPQPQWMEYTPFALREVALRSGLPLDVSAWWPRQATARLQGLPREVDITLVDPAFERIAGLRAEQGDLQQALTRPDGLAVTRQAARQLFGDAAGDTSALGRTVEINGQTVQVRAVLADRPANSTIQFGILVGVDTALWPEPERRAALANWMGIGGRIYIRTGPGVQPAALQQALQNVIDRAPWGNMATPEMKAALGQRKMVDIALGPLADAYFDRSVAGTMGTGPRGDRRLVLAMAGAGVLILLLAALNYVNLAAMRVVRRQREIAMRRVLGASGGQLLAQFMAESVLLATAAAAAGVLLAWLLAPVASDLLVWQTAGLFSPASVAAALAAGVLLGAAAGVYPGWLARGVDLARVLSHRSGETAAGPWLRRALAAVQFGAAMAMGAVALAILWQTRFAAAAPAGFDAAPLLVVELPAGDATVRVAALRDALARLPGVAGVADSRSVPGRDDGTGTLGSVAVQRVDGSSASLTVYAVGADFFNVYGLAQAAGRLFDPGLDRVRSQPAGQQADQPAPPQGEPDQPVVLNDAAVRALGWQSAAQAVGQRITGTRYRIVGIAPAIRWESLRAPVRPILYALADDSNLLTVRLAGRGDESEVVAAQVAIAATAARYVQGTPPVVRRAGSYAAEAYAADERVARMLGWATAMVLALAAFGVYAMAAASVQRRGREIVLRKLHGAGRAAIAALVAREFVLLTAAAALLGLPLAVLGVERYLAPFVAHAPLGRWAPLATLALALLVVVLA
ncbi:ABC transporter permease, partial [Duganella phyllosphaerae]|uniref:ABC transporter permease n=1 Tax=Duganella phyllosphaerae TaxID=762836 RepID=UPI000874F385